MREPKSCLARRSNILGISYCCFMMSQNKRLFIKIKIFETPTKLFQDSCNIVKAAAMMAIAGFENKLFINGRGCFSF